MGTSLPPGLVTASKAPAPGGTDKAFKTFLTTASVRKRINDLVDGKRFAGFYYEAGDKVRTLYIPKIVTPEVTTYPDGTDPSEGETWEGFLGQGSNATARAMFDLISTDICKCALVVSDGSIPVPPCFTAGDPFTKADAEATCPSLAPLLSTGVTTYRLVKLPLCIPINYGVTQVCKGRIDEGHRDAFESNAEGSSFWLEARPSWSIATQTAALLDAPSMRRGMFPKLTKDQDWAIYGVESRRVSEDDEDTFAAEINDLTQALLTMTRVQSGDNPPDDLSPSGDIPPIVSATHGSTPAALSDFSDVELRCHAFLLAGSGYDPTTSSIVAPTLHPEAEYLFGTSRMVLLNANVQSYLGEIKTNHRDSFDFLERMIDIPQVDLLACAWLVNSKFSATILVDVDTPITSRSLLRWTMFAADTAHSAKTRAAAGSDREAQLLMGETAENLDKVDVSLRTGTHYLSYNTFLTLLANIAGIVGSFYVCNKQDIEAPTNPLIYRFARQVAFELSSDDSRTWLKHNPGQARHLFCWWVSILDQFTRLSVGLAKNPKHIMFFGQDRLSALPTSGHEEALQILADAIKRYRKILKNLESVPITAIATAWESHLAKDRAKKPEPTATKRTTFPGGDTDALPPKRARTTVDPTVDRSGPLVYTGEAKLMPSPSLPIHERICAAHARDGYACRHQNCKFIHEKDVTLWPVGSFLAWSDLVEKTSGLSWNPALVSAKALGMKLTKDTTPASPATK
jgi:hypothetical protein